MRRAFDTAAFATLTALIVLIIISKDAKAGALDGIRLCEGTVIPSLLPILIICNLITVSRAKNAIERFTGKIFTTVFGLEKSATAALLLGLIGGYPTGAVLAHSLYKSGEISGDTAKRLMRCCFCGGAGFIITAVGAACYKSVKAGIALFLSSVLSSFICALIFRGKRSVNTSQKAALYKPPDYVEAFTLSVEKAVRALAVMSANIILFSALAKTVKIPRPLVPLFEITNGICAPDNMLPLPECAFFLSFGGLCVHLQIIGYLKEMGVKYLDFLAGRLICSALSYALCRIYVLLFPQSEAVFSNVSAPAHALTQSGLGAGALMVLGCAVAVFDIENRKIKLH